MYRDASDSYADKGRGVLKEEEKDEEGNKKEDSRAKFANRDLEYPILKLVICKRGRLMPSENPNGERVNPGENDEVIAYVEGAEGD